MQMKRYKSVAENILIYKADESVEYMVYLEKEYLLSTKSLLDALADIIFIDFVQSIYSYRRIYTS